MMSTTTLRVAALVVLMLAGGCGSGGDETSTGATPSTDLTSTTMPETTTTLLPTTTTTMVTTTSTAPTTTTLPPFPETLEDLEHGGRVWAVVLAAVDAPTGQDPVLDAAVAAAGDAGYLTGATNCDMGASEALGVPAASSMMTVSVYFDSDSSARAAATAFEARGIETGVGQVQTYCLD
jgi:hypothetical protein